MAVYFERSGNRLRSLDQLNVSRGRGGEGGVNAKPNLMGSKNQMAATGASSLEIIKDSRRKERKKKELSSTDCEAPGFVMVTCGRARGMSNGRPI